MWSGGGGGKPPSAAVSVTVGNNLFRSDRNSTVNPAVDTVLAGGTVTWTWVNTGVVPHTVQSLGTPSFTSSALESSSGSSYQLTFNAPGKYQYNCAVHGNMMTGWSWCWRNDGRTGGQSVGRSRLPFCCPVCAPGAAATGRGAVRRVPARQRIPRGTDARHLLGSPGLQWDQCSGQAHPGHPGTGRSPGALGRSGDRYSDHLPAGQGPREHGCASRVGPATDRSAAAARARA